MTKKRRLKEAFEDTKEVIRFRNSKVSQHNCQGKRANNDLQNTTQKTKKLATRTPLKGEGDLMCYGRVGSFCSTIRTCRIT